MQTVLKTLIMFAILGIQSHSWAGWNFSDKYSYEDFKGKILLDSKVKTVDQALHSLPNSLRSNYTLMKQSSSLQAASPANPRAILFGDTASLILTVNGHPRQAGYGEIELADYNEKTDRILFRTVVFRAESDPNVQWTKEAIAQKHQLDPDLNQAVEYFDERVLISRPNQAVCMACHAANRSKLEETLKLAPENRLARYNWAQYPIWPGAYGEEEDKLSSNEEKDYTSYLKARNSNNRYRALFHPGSSYETFPYQSGNRNLGELPDISETPNTRLTMLLSLRYAKQMARVIFNSESYRANSYSLLAGLASCDRAEDADIKMTGDLASRWQSYRSSQQMDTRLSKYVFSDFANRYGQLGLNFLIEESKDEFNYNLPLPPIEESNSNFSELLLIQLANLDPSLSLIRDASSFWGQNNAYGQSKSQNQKFISYLNSNHWYIPSLLAEQSHPQKPSRDRICDLLKFRAKNSQR